MRIPWAICVTKLSVLKTKKTKQEQNKEISHLVAERLGRRT